MSIVIKYKILDEKTGEVKENLLFQEIHELFGISSKELNIIVARKGRFQRRWRITQMEREKPVNEPKGWSPKQIREWESVCKVARLLADGKAKIVQNRSGKRYTVLKGE